MSKKDILQIKTLLKVQPGKIYLLNTEVLLLVIFLFYFGQYIKQQRDIMQNFDSNNAVSMQASQLLQN